MGPVGAFKLDIGPQTPTYYVLIRSDSAEALVGLDAKLGADAEYVKGAAGFRDAPAAAPAFERSERSLLGAFTGWPKLDCSEPRGWQVAERIFQLRTYRARARWRIRGDGDVQRGGDRDLCAGRIEPRILRGYF